MMQEVAKLSYKNICVDKNVACLSSIVSLAIPLSPCIPSCSIYRNSAVRHKVENIHALFIGEKVIINKAVTLTTGFLGGNSELSVITRAMTMRTGLPA